MKVLPEVTVLYTSAGGLGYPSHVRCLRAVKERKIRIIGTAQDKNAAGFAFIDKGYLVPATDDKSFIEEILRICEKEDVKVVFPVAPQELDVFAQAKRTFEQNGIKVVISPLESLRIANNKYLLYKYCREESIPAPESFRAENYKEFEKAVFNLGYPEKQVCFKPVVSSGSRGFRVLASKVEQLNLLLTQQPDSTLTSLEEVSSLLDKAEKFPELLVMEYLPGDEYSIDIVADKGCAVAIVPRIREKIILGASFIGRVVKHEQIIEYSQKVTSGLRLDGALGIQFKLNEEGIPKVIEVNARPHGALMLSAAAGVNILYLAIKLALGEKAVQPNIKWNTRMIRYYDEVYQNETGDFFRI